MKVQIRNYQHPQRLAAAGVLLFVLVLLSACKAQPTAKDTTDDVVTGQAVIQEQQALPSDHLASSPQEASPSASRSSNGTARETPDIGGAIKLGMTYATLRQSLQSQGWVPVIDSQCRANVVGANHQKLCGEHPELARCSVCGQLPGLASCSGSGDCLLKFRSTSDTETLAVSMSGDIKSWNEPGPDAMFYVSGWRHAAETEK